MMKCCKHCGSLLEDDVHVCDFCGAVLEMPKAEPVPQAVAVAEAPAHEVVAEKTEISPKKKLSKKAKLFIAGGVALGVIAIAVAVYLLFFNPHIALTKYAAVQNGDFHKVESLAPREYWIHAAKIDATSVESYIDSEAEKLRKNYAHMQETESPYYGKLKSMSYQVTDTEMVSSKDLRGIKETLAQQYEIDGNLVGAAYNLIVKVIYHGTECDYIEVAYVTAIQINGQWYLIRYRNYQNEYSAHFLRTFYLWP